MAGRFVPLILGCLVAATLPVRAVTAQDLMTMPLVELERRVTGEHPSAYFILASRSFEAGKRDEATRWLYVAQLRYRFHIAANPGLPPDGDSALFGSLMETIGRPINEWAGGDVDGWIAAMQNALDWDAANPNGFTSSRAHPAELRTVRAGLADLIVSIEAQRDEIPGERARNGLESRTR